MRNISIDVIEPVISNKFAPSKFPAKPVVAIHSREPRDTMNIIKQFYVKFPQYRWITFRDMRGLSVDEFSNVLRDCMVSVWIDDVSSFGTFPLESMASNVPVIAKTPNIHPEWMNENNGIWVQNTINVIDILADFIQNWLEDNISANLYTQGIQTSELYKDDKKFESQVLSLFEKYKEARIENFSSEINKLELENAN
jgi:glycosyltransferase involved in cell wall biosynthesis